LENNNFDHNLAMKIEAEKRRIFEEQMKSDEEELEEEEELDDDNRDERINTRDIK
jgi:hypothetical protein